MPVWNVARYVKQSVRSVLDQTYRDFELIIVDDGSTDETPQILAELAASDSRIRIIRQTNGGIVKALNRGISDANGKYIARADGDDLYHPNRFAEQLEYLESHPKAVLVGCDYDLCYPDGTRVRMSLPTEHRDILRRLFLRNEIMHSSVMMRRAELVAAGSYVERWRHLEDYELWFRLSQFGELGSIPRCLASYRLFPTGISQEKEIYQVRHGILLRLQVLARKQAPISWSRYMTKHLFKAAMPLPWLRLQRRLTGGSRGLQSN